LCASFEDESHDSGLWLANLERFARSQPVTVRRSTDNPVSFGSFLSLSWQRAFKDPPVLRFRHSSEEAESEGMVEIPLSHCPRNDPALLELVNRVNRVPLCPPEAVDRPNV
jgi:hypothetical protein